MTAYEVRISDWRSDVCSSDLSADRDAALEGHLQHRICEASELGDRRARPARCRLHEQGELERRLRAAARDAWRGDIRRPDRHPEQRRQIWARAVCAKSLRCLQTDGAHLDAGGGRSEEHTSELQSLMRISYAGLCLKKIRS